MFDSGYFDSSKVKLECLAFERERETGETRETLLLFIDQT
jgi:hypothetical protein